MRRIKEGAGEVGDRRETEKRDSEPQICLFNLEIYIVKPRAKECGI